MFLTHLRRILLLLAIGLVVPFLAHADAAPPPQAAGFYRLHVGEIEVTALRDGAVDLADPRPLRK